MRKQHPVRLWAAAFWLLVWEGASLALAATTGGRMLLLASPTAMQASPAADWLPRTIDLVLLPASEAALLVLLLVKTLGIFTRKYYKIGKNGEKPKKPWLKRGKRQRPRFGIFD